MRRGRTTSDVYRCQFGMAKTERREALEERRWREEEDKEEEGWGGVMPFIPHYRTLLKPW